MKNIFILGLATIAYLSTHAAPNDTTIVVAHHKTELSWYGNYDTLTSFPDGNTSYRKIVMEFNIGKYDCPGYNPNTAGEGPGRSGWCADWDYDVHAIAMTAAGDTIELGRLITPYANSNNPSTPTTWNQSYYYDVTDYYHILKDDVTIRIFYAGYSGGFTGTIKFHMIEGTRARNVLGYEKLWMGGYSYGIDTFNINTQIDAKTLNLAQYNPHFVEVKSIITGHGGDNQENCAEFCRKYYTVQVNDTNTATQYIWRDDCGNNFLYPQSGTWVYNRANWCPGDLVKTITHPIPERYINGRDSLNIDFNFQNYVYTGNNRQASYKLTAVAFYYDSLNHNIDVGIEDIISPSNITIHNRSNPVCNTGKIKIKNYGKGGVINSITFKYGVNGNLSETFTWNGNLALNEEKEIEIPLNTLLDALSGTNLFEVAIDKVNGADDDEPYNNEYATYFDASALLKKGTYILKTLPPGGGQTTKVRFTDANNSDILNKSYSRSGTDVITEVINLTPGCYKFTLSGTRGMGMNFMGAFATGYSRLYVVENGDTVRVALPKSDLGNGGYEGNFGSEASYSFRVSNESTGINNNPSSTNIHIYPNPAQNQFHIELEKTNPSNKVEVFNILGQKIYSEAINSTYTTINTTNWNSGLFTVVISSQEGIVYQTKVIIE
jgi:hypothetical protein